MSSESLFNSADAVSGDPGGLQWWSYTDKILKDLCVQLFRFACLVAVGDTDRFARMWFMPSPSVPHYVRRVSHGVFAGELYVLIFWPRFYRATLCVSAVCRQVSVRPSVLSVTLVHSIHMAEDIVKLFCRPGSPIILVFLIPSTDTQFQGEPFQRGAKYKGWEFFCVFRLESPSISETERDAHGCYGSLIGSPMRSIEW